MKRVLAHIGFSVGTTLLVLNFINVNYISLALPIIIIGLVVLFAASLILKKYRQALAVPICIASAIFACLVFVFVFNTNAKPQLDLNNKTAQASFYIVELPQYRNGKYTYTVKTQSIQQEDSPQNIKLRITTKYKIDAEPYQIIEGRLNFKSLADNAFNSYGYWADNVFLTGQIKGYQVTDDSVPSLNKYILQLREHISTRLYNLLPNDNGALTIALLIGDMSYLTDDAYNSFKLSGTTHIMAVSGMHLVVITAALTLLLKRIPMPSPVRAVLMFLGIVAYVALAGFAKSIIRAAIMTTVLLIADLFKTRSDALNSLGASITIMCLNPFALCDVGAMLSVLAVLSLLTIANPVTHKILKSKAFDKPILKYLVESVVITLCVMIYTLPVSYMFFGYISLSGVLANVILVPVGTVTMVLSFFEYLSSFLGVVSVPFVWLAKAATQFMLSVSNVFASSKIATLDISANYFIIMAFCMFALSIAFFTKKAKNVRFAAWFSVALLVVTIPFSNYFSKPRDFCVFICQDSAYVVSYNGLTVVGGVDSSSDYYSVSNFLFKNNLCADVVVYNTSGKSDYCVDLAQKYNAQAFLSSKTSTYIQYDLPSVYSNFSKHQQYVLTNNYSVTLQGSKTVINCNGVLVCSNGDSAIADININSQTVTDFNGNIDLSQSNIVYYIEDNQIYVRRVD